jgi:hypothetical protein
MLFDLDPDSMIFIMRTLYFKEPQIRKTFFRARAILHLFSTVIIYWLYLFVFTMG